MPRSSSAPRRPCGVPAHALPEGPVFNGESIDHRRRGLELLLRLHAHLPAAVPRSSWDAYDNLPYFTVCPELDAVLMAAACGDHQAQDELVTALVAMDGYWQHRLRSGGLIADGLNLAGYPHGVPSLRELRFGRPEMYGLRPLTRSVFQLLAPRPKVKPSILRRAANAPGMSIAGQSMLLAALEAPSTVDHIRLGGLWHAARLHPRPTWTREFLPHPGGPGYKAVSIDIDAAACVDAMRRLRPVAPR